MVNDSFFFKEGMKPLLGYSGSLFEAVSFNGDKSELLRTLVIIALKM